MNIKFLTLMSAAALFLGSCSSEPKESENAGQETAATEEAAAPAEEKPVVELTIEGNDQMKFNLDKLEVPAGSKVKLTFKNVGKMPKEAMGHNWTLLEAGVDVASYGQAAATAKDNDYQPADRYADVIVHTKVLGPGEEETIEFDAPEAGTYKFICTFPGHYGLMQGDFIVK